MSEKYALIIANTEYTDPGLAQLTAPGRDAEDFARVLKDHDICAFDDVNILLNQPEHIVRGTIDEFFDQKKPDDLLILYFSGHGVRDELGALYLAVKNTIRTRLRSTAIKSDYIREAMDQSRSKRQVLILDCCNSGAFSQGTKAATGVSIGTASAFEVGYGRIILTASDSTQFAWEGEKVIGETDNSLFTHYLVQGLEGEADLDGDGSITVDELYDYAYDKVKLATPKQTPSKFSSKQQGEIVLRQSMRVEDIKPATLPAALLDSLENPFSDVRLGAVQQLIKLLNGKNLALARAAREALERVAEEDDSRTVSRAAFQAVEVIRQAEQLELQKAEEERLEVERKAKEEAERLLAEQKAEEERKTKKEAKRLAALKAKEERLEREKAEAEELAKQRAEDERKAQAEAERLLAQEKVEEKRREREEAERITILQAEQERSAREKAEAERKAKEEAERLLAEKRAEEEAERLAALKAEEERLAREKADREAKTEAERKAAQEVEHEQKEATLQLTMERGETESSLLEAQQEPLDAVKTQNDRPLKPNWSVIIFTIAALLIIFVLVERSSTAPVRLILGGESPPFTLAGQTYEIKSVAFSPDGKLLAAAYKWPITVQIWNLKDHTTVKTIDSDGDRVAFSPDGQSLAIGGFISLNLLQVSNFTEHFIRLSSTEAQYHDLTSDVTFSPNGQYVASGTIKFPPDKYFVEIWQVNDGTLVQTLLGHTDRVNSIAFSLDGQYLASASTDGTIRLWRTSNWTLINMLNTQSSIDSVAFSPDGQLLASGGTGGTILWRIDDGTKIATFDTSLANSVAFSPDGQKLASGLGFLDYDSRVLMWRVSDYTLLNTFQGHTGPVNSVAFSPDGKLLASGSDDGTVRLWNVIP